MDKTDWEKLELGLKKYLSIMKDFEYLDVAKDLEFQKKFKAFYRVRRAKEFCDLYFSLLQNNKWNKELSFESVLRELSILGKVEASFTSKLIATINPDMPVWDKVVLTHIENELPTTSESDDRIKETTEKYNFIVNFYKKKNHSIEGKRMIQSFNERLPAVNITDIKKIDLILWQTRS